MKRTITILMTAMLLAVLTAPTFAQGRSSRRVYDSQTYYDNSQSYYDYSGAYRDRSVWDRHRDKLTVAAGTVGGAAIGGLIGGRRGAVIGAVAGLGSTALYTYKLRNRGFRF